MNLKTLLVDSKAVVFVFFLFFIFFLLKLNHT